MKLISFLLSYYKKFGMNFYLFLCAFSCLESCCLFNISNFVVARKAQKTLVCHHENYKNYEARCLNLKSPFSEYSGELPMRLSRDISFWKEEIF